MGNSISDKLKRLVCEALAPSLAAAEERDRRIREELDGLRARLAAVTEHSNRMEAELAKSLALQQEMIEAMTQLEERLVGELENGFGSSVKQIDKQIEWWTGDRFKRTDKQIERWTWERYTRTRKHAQEFHRHVDFTYRDVMVALERQQSYLPNANIKLVTDAPIAYESLDHLYPHGTIRDNTRYPRFVKKCEDLLGGTEDLSFLDLGCSGGGMVLEAALRGHLSIGLEGSDCSLKEQRAEWRLLGNRLQTCDITKAFRLENGKGELQRFDIITAWEVMEHIAEEDLPQLFQNILLHLKSGGYFIASIANWEDVDSVSGVNWHITMRPYQWWKTKFEENGFVVCSELLQPIDLARGAYNPPHCYETPHLEFNAERAFHIVAKIDPKKC